jgi:predicted RNA binding protein YcfA (HicA-like mRNA interferase family)
MRTKPAAVRFGHLQSLLKYEDFQITNKCGIHFTYHHDDGRLLVVVRPHGRHKTCHPKDIRKVLEELDL